LKSCLIYSTPILLDDSLLAGGMHGVLRTTTLRQAPTRALDTLRRLQQPASLPPMASEVWIGWFDSWALPAHFVRDAADVGALVGEMLEIGMSFNL
jgi:hypothetical protein